MKYQKSNRYYKMFVTSNIVNIDNYIEISFDMTIHLNIDIPILKYICPSFDSCNER